MRSPRRTFTHFLVLIGLVLFATGGSALAQDEGARLRVAHFAAGAPAVDIYVDGQRKVANVRNESISEYLVLATGPHTVEVRAAGTAATSAAVLAQKITLTDASRSTLAVLGKPGDLSAAVFADDVSSPAPGKARLRLIHAAPDATALDLTLDGAASEVSNVTFGKTKSAEVDATRYELALRPTGSTTDAVKTAVPLQAGQVLTVIALADGTNVKLKGLTDRAAENGTTASASTAATASTAAPASTAVTPVTDPEETEQIPLADEPTTTTPADTEVSADTEPTDTDPADTEATEDTLAESTDTEPADTEPADDSVADTEATDESTPEGGVETGFGGLSGGSSAAGAVLALGAAAALAGAATHRRLRRR